MEWEHAILVSLSLPLREDRYIGAPGIDACSLLSAIGREYVGALQFPPNAQTRDDIARSAGKIEGAPVDEDDIGRIVNNPARAARPG